MIRAALGIALLVLSGACATGSRAAEAAPPLLAPPSDVTLTLKDGSTPVASLHLTGIHDGVDDKFSAVTAPTAHTTDGNQLSV